MKYRISIGCPSVGEQEAEAAYRVVKSGRLTQGPEVSAAETTFCDLARSQHAVAVANGTVALQLALKSHDIGPGDEVITTAFSFFATAASIINVGATPVFVDIDPTTYNIDPDAVSQALTSKTKAIMPVHLYGRIAEMNRLQQIARSANAVIIEDAAQAVGSLYNGEPAGSAGNAACFSFYGAKNITSGEGGMIITDDAERAEHMRKLRNHGSSQLYIHDEVSSNYRMTDVQAAILRVQLEKLEKITIRRQENAAVYDRAIDSANVVLPVKNDDENISCHHQYTIRVLTDRDGLKQHLADNGIETRTFYPVPLHQQPALAALTTRSLPNAELAAQQVLSLPVHPGCNEDELTYVASLINNYAPSQAFRTIR